MNYGYIRVSTQEQNLENQRKAISNFYHIDEWVEEKKSGTIDYHKRNLGELINRLTSEDTLIVTEISRLGRSLMMIYEIIAQLTKKNCRVIAIKNNFDFNPNGSNQITSQVLIFAFGISAQIERDLISERTKQGLEVAKQRGKLIGRQKGEKVYNVKLRQYQNELIEKRKTQSINSLAKEYHVTWSTMNNFFKKFIKMKKHKPIKREIR